jgi:beta-glucosidase
MMNAKEEHDRTTIALPPCQQALMDAVNAANANTALVLFSNYPYAFHASARAALWSATGAQDMGLAMAETLLGRNAPSGRLNMTWYLGDDQLPDIDDYDIIKGKRTYRYFDGEVQYPFGHGLTYTGFAYSNLSVKPEDGELRVSFMVTNTGSAVSDEVAQVYAAAPASRVKKPLKQLVGFERLKAVKPGETRQVCISVPTEELRFYDVISRSLMVEEGRYTIMAGRSSGDLPLQAQADVPGLMPGMRDAGSRTPAECYDDYENMLLTQGQHGFTAAALADIINGGLPWWEQVDPEELAVIL